MAVRWSFGWHVCHNFLKWRDVSYRCSAHIGAFVQVPYFHLLTCVTTMTLLAGSRNLDDPPCQGRNDRPPRHQGRRSDTLFVFRTHRVQAQIDHFRFLCPFVSPFVSSLRPYCPSVHLFLVSIRTWPWLCGEMDA